MSRGDSDDRLLGEAVLPLLQSLAAVPDVRPKLHARFNMPRWFKAQGVSLPLQITRRPTQTGRNLYLLPQLAPLRTGASTRACTCDTSWM